VSRPGCPDHHATDHPELARPASDSETSDDRTIARVNPDLDRDEDNAAVSGAIVTSLPVRLITTTSLRLFGHR
jgi:hypothetical protein